MLLPRPDNAVGFYSFLRYVGDPLQDESVNVGLFLVSQDGGWARFKPHATKRRIEAIGRSSDLVIITHWVTTLTQAYGLGGERGMFGDAVNADLLRDWARDSGGILRLSEPRVAIDADMETLWASLWRRYMRRGRGPDLQPRAVGERRMTGAEERVEIVDAFVEAASEAPNFDPTRVTRWERFEGTRLAHVVDVAIRNGVVSAVAQAIPFVHGSDVEIIERRALILDAAVDLPSDVVKLAIYEDPPPERTEILAGTRAVFEQLAPDHRIDMYPSREFSSLIERIAPSLFPVHQ